MCWPCQNSRVWGGGHEASSLVGSLCAGVGEVRRMLVVVGVVVGVVVIVIGAHLEDGLKAVKRSLCMCMDAHVRM